MENYINVWAILGILFIHWIFDFIFQTDKDAKGKSTSIKCLLNHTFFYSLYWTIPMMALVVFHDKPFCILWFVPITFVAHTITDYFTSKLNTHLYKKGDIHNFFVSVGFDQWLHVVQLLLTYQILNTL